MHCPSCFSDSFITIGCPQCRYHTGQRRESVYLPVGTSLHNGEYIVGKVLGKPGGFGITYLAWDTRLDIKVAIKEYLPFQIAARSADGTSVSIHTQDYRPDFEFGLEKFLEEAKTLAQFRHPNIIRVLNFFRENGTAYMVMDYLEGESLAEYLARVGKLKGPDAVALFLPVLDGLEHIHSKNVLHRDIKPANIYLTEKGQAILLDFGSARQSFRERSQSLTAVITPGFAPWEQYHRKGKQGPWTDVYACAATLYLMLTGVVPPDGAERAIDDDIEPLEVLAPRIDGNVAEAIMQGMAVNAATRPQAAGEFKQRLLGESNIKTASPYMEDSVLDSPSRGSSFGNSINTSKEQKETPKSFARISIVVLFVVLIAGGWYFWGNKASEIKPDIKARAIIPVSTEKKVLQNALFPYKSQGKYGYADSNGKIVIQPTYGWASMFYEGVARVSVSDGLNSKCGLIDQAGKWVVEPKYSWIGKPSDGRMVYSLGTGRETRKVGVMDTKGTLITQALYDYVTVFKAGMSLVGVGRVSGDAKQGSIDKWGLIDINGKYVVQPSWSSREVGYGAYSEAEGLPPQSIYSEGLIPILNLVSQTWGYMDINKKWIIAPQFVSAQHFSDGMAAVGINKIVEGKPQIKYGYLNKSGRMSVEPIFDAAMPFSDGMALVGIGTRYDTRKWGFIKLTGEYAIEPQYNYMQVVQHPNSGAAEPVRFKEGLSMVSDSKGKLGEPYSWKYMDKTGRVLSMDFGNGRIIQGDVFENGISRITILSGEMKTEKYIDVTGKVVFDPDSITRKN